MGAKVSRRKFLWSLFAVPVAAKLAPAIKFLPPESSAGNITMKTLEDGFRACWRQAASPEYIFVPTMPLYSNPVIDLSQLIRSYKGSSGGRLDDKWDALARPLSRYRGYQEIARQCLHVEPLPKGAYAYLDYRAPVHNEARG
jgi:hypothetical protein